MQEIRIGVYDQMTMDGPADKDPQSNQLVFLVDLENLGFQIGNDNLQPGTDPSPGLKERTIAVCLQ
ncbi:MAG: hypothetical protein QNJ78_04675 [Gammaproteobacteria bacterium]|nr:hypothetical protein [Gammaproteobacteria bacterium]